MNSIVEESIMDSFNRLKKNRFIQFSVVVVIICYIFGIFLLGIELYLRDSSIIMTTKYIIHSPVSIISEEDISEEDTISELQTVPNGKIYRTEMYGVIKPISLHDYKLSYIKFFAYTEGFIIVLLYTIQRSKSKKFLKFLNIITIIIISILGIISLHWAEGLINYGYIMYIVWFFIIFMSIFHIWFLLNCRGDLNDEIDVIKN